MPGQQGKKGGDDEGTDTEKYKKEPDFSGFGCRDFLERSYGNCLRGHYGIRAGSRIGDSRWADSERYGFSRQCTLNVDAKVKEAEDRLKAAQFTQHSVF